MIGSSFTFDRMRQQLVDHLPHDVGAISGQLRLVEDLGIDSLAMHALLIDLEEAGGRIPSPDVLQQVTTVADLFAVVSGAPSP